MPACSVRPNSLGTQGVQLQDQARQLELHHHRAPSLPSMLACNEDARLLPDVEYDDTVHQSQYDTCPQCVLQPITTFTSKCDLTQLHCQGSINIDQKTHVLLQTVPLSM